MKKYSIAIALTASFSLWNCKPDQLDQVRPTNNQSAARVAAEAPPTRQWDLTLGGEGTDKATATVTNWNGNIVIGGVSDSPATGEKQYNPAYGGLDYWIAQLNPDGTVVGKQTLGGSGDDYLTAIATSTDRGLLVGGYSNSPAAWYKYESCKGSMDYYVVKLSAKGSAQWNRTLGGSSSDILSSIVATNDGGFLLAGSSASPADGNKTQNTIFGSYDYWIVKVDARGNKQWDKTIGSRNDDHLTSAVATSDGGFLLAGYSGTQGGGGDKTQAGRGDQDYWVVKVDANGNKQWDQVFGGSGEDKLAAVVVGSDGGFLLGGSSTSPASGDKSQVSFWKHDYWVVKIDANGNKLWDKTLKATADEELTSLAVTSDGGFLLGGTSAGLPELDKSQPQKGLGDFWIVKLDNSGNKLWDVVAGGTSNWDYLAALVTTSDGGIVASGYSQSNAGGDKTDTHKGYYDYWVVKPK